MNFPRHDKYKASGVEWLGKVPEHWHIQRLKFLFNLVKRPPELQDGIVTAFRDGEVTLRENRRVEGFTNAIHEIGYQGIRPGDLVIHAMDAFAGAIGVSDSSGKSTPVYSVCTPIDPEIDAHYYAALLRHMALSGYVNALAKGIRERSTEFRWADASEVVLPVPSHDEQRSIVAFLEHESAKIDTLVEEQKCLIEMLKEKRQAVISQAVTKGLDPNVPMKDSGVEWLGKVPAHWVVKSIKWLSPVLRGASPRPIDDQKYFDEAGEYAWVRIADASASNGVLLETTQRLSALGSSLSVKLEPGSLFVSIAGTVGKPCIAGIKCCIHDGFVYFPRLNIDPKFIFRLFEHGACYAGLGKMGTQLNLNTDTIGSIRIGVPPAQELNEILGFIEGETRRFDELIAEADSAMALLRERRSALISAAVTGKIDVRAWRKQEELEPA